MSLEYRKWLTFVSFVIVAGLLWFVFKYKEVYTEHLLVKIVWNNIPGHIKLKEDTVYEIDLELTGTGFDLLNTSYFSPYVELDFTKYVLKTNDVYYFNPKIATGTLKSQLSDKFKVEYISDQIIPIDLIEYMTKKVPLSAVFNVSFEGDLKSIQAPFFYPDSVIVTGNDEVINTIQVLKVKHKDLVIQDTLLRKKINLEEQFVDLKIEPPIVEYTVKASFMTEGTFIVPVSVVNIPDNLSVKIIPSEVEVVFNCQLKDYQNIKQTDFIINIDYKDLENDYNLMPVEVRLLNEKVTSTRVSSQQVQILLMK